MEVNLMHAGEEIVWVLIPAFAIYMLFDLAKKRKSRAQQQEEDDPDSVSSSGSGPDDRIDQ